MIIFKTALVTFLINSLQDDSLTVFLEDKHLLVTHEKKCYEFKSNEGKMIMSEKQELDCSHEEADSRILFHVNSIQPPNNVVIRASDSNILIIALGNMDKLPHGINLWLEVGISSKDSLRFINVNELHKQIGSTLSKSLPGFHAFTGSDYTASFCRKGKIRPKNLRKK